MKLLISWLAHNNDFKDGKASKDGPTYLFHQNFYNHDKHLILYSDKRDELRAEHLRNRLNIDFKDHKIEFICMNLEDVINVNEIKTKVERVLGAHSGDAIDIFLSPGTPSMQVAWYLCHTSLGLNTNLYQMRPPQFGKDKGKAELIKVDVEKSSVPITTILYETSMDRDKSDNDYIITKSIEEVYDRARKVAETDNITVMIEGKSGTGKEHLAKYIHEISVRKIKPYLTINCSALGDNLLESRLFGYRKGAFTGADKDTQGLFEEANEGTIFLDEIGDISSYMQQSLLRVLQEKEIMPIGAKAKKVDVRVISATNKDLKKMCEDGKFRWDLYYRLSIVELELPTLLQRGREDKKAMIEFFINQKKRQLRKPKKLSFTKSALDVLLDYSYPGNIRELENIIARLYVYHDYKIELDNLPEDLVENPVNQPLTWEHIERAHIKRVLAIHNGNQRQTSLSIGWSINTLKGKIKKYSL